jgi:O-antigen/teichoic acid export membrane protein
LTSLAQRALGGAAATLLWQGARMVLLLVSLVVLARLLAPEDYGLLAMVTSLTGIGELLRDFGLSMASLQSKTLSAGERSNLFWLNTAIGAGLTVATFLASWPIAHLYGDDRLVAITQVLSVTFLVNGVATQFKAQINRDLRFVALGVTEVVPQAVGLVAAIAVAVVVHSYWALAVQALVVAVLGALLCGVLAHWRPGRYRRAVPVARFVRFAGALVGTQSLSYVSKNVDSVLLGILVGPAQLGAYNRAYQIVVLPLNQLAAPLSRVAIPVLSQLQDTFQGLKRYLTTAQFATVTIGSICYGAVVGFGRPLVRVTLGTGWLEVVPILQILAVSGVFRALGQVSYWLFVSLGETGKQLRLYLVGQPVIIAAIAVGAVWGEIGVAVGCSAGYAAFWVLSIWWTRRVTSFPIVQLALSGLALVALFAVPVAGLGTVAVHVTDDDRTALGAGGIAVATWVAAVLWGAPRYRVEVTRFLRLARHHPGPAPLVSEGGLDI